MTELEKWAYKELRRLDKKGKKQMGYHSFAESLLEYPVKMKMTNAMKRHDKLQAILETDQ